MKFLYFNLQSSHRLHRWQMIPMCLSLILSLSLLLNACGGGGGATAGGGIDGTGIMSAGVVTAFGSIEVNGTEFDTSNALVIVNGVEKGFGDEVVKDHLRIGMVVSVDGRILRDGRIVADRVIYSSTVVGPVENISSLDETTKEIVVLGQTVIINIITKFEPDTYTFDSIALDDLVEVSGYLDDNRVIRATFIENIADDVEFEITGFIENLDSDSKTFQINDLTVDYSLVNPSDLPVDFRDDLFVEVKGELVSGELIASGIELGDDLEGEDGDEFEIMGFVTKVVSAFEFFIGNQVVIIDENTVKVDELPGGIQPGVKLEAEGVFEGGVLFADEIEFWKPDQIEIEEIVTEVISATEFKFEETLVQTDGNTVFEPEDLVVEVGLEIEVKGVPQNLEQSVIKADKVSFEIE